MNRINLDTNDIVKLYKSGVSEKAIAERFGCSRGAIRLRLKQSGIICRGRSESMYVRMASLTTEQRKSLTLSAHNAVRGRKRTHQELVKRAKSKEGVILNTSTYERQLCVELVKRGFPFIAQKAVDKYNIDFLIFDTIAFEIFGGGWHFSGGHAIRFRNRDKLLRDSGYVPVYCVVSHKRFDPIAICDYLVGLRDILRQNPASRSEQYVIRGSGDTSTTISSKFNDFA